ncbi:hypothetical protein OF83DRAFT_1089366 [Amylostereum chailletii]|nr:hypothetical protein OF83DRAFT_1089366 [Amylostereum chailletii]
MAGCRLVVNEHWGKPNSEWPGGLFWENTFLRRKAVSAGWKNKKSTPWAPAHDLIRASLPAHTRDGFRIHSGEEDVQHAVLQELFSTQAADHLRDMPDADRDYTYENNVLYNRDALHYLVFVTAIKHGDIGCVVNVLRVWGVMMRGVMPRYADAIFETLAWLEKSLFLHNWLVNLTGHENRFKEVDLLQEHQHFWAKVMYTAKGVNKSWKWLSMIMVCIFTLRDAMRTVHKVFKIPDYGIHHSTPASQNEVRELADELKHGRLQEYVRNRLAQTFVSPVRDMFHHGADYANQPKAFHAFRQDPHRARYAKTTTVLPTNLAGPNESILSEQPVPPTSHPSGAVAPEGVHDEDVQDDDGLDDRPTEADLAVDDEEFYDLGSNILARAIEMMEDLDILGDDRYD